MAKRSSGTEAPSPDPVLTFLQAIWRLEHALERASRRMQETLGLSGPQRFALRMIGNQPGLTAGELAAALHLHPSTLTGVLQRLESRGLLRRQASRGDARVTQLRLTRAGARANRPSAPGTVERAARSTLRRCSDQKRRVATEVLDHLTRELMKL